MESNLNVIEVLLFPKFVNSHKCQLIGYCVQQDQLVVHWVGERNLSASNITTQFAEWLEDAYEEITTRQHFDADELVFRVFNKYNELVPLDIGDTLLSVALHELWDKQKDLI